MLWKSCWKWPRRRVRPVLALERKEREWNTFVLKFKFCYAVWCLCCCCCCLHCFWICLFVCLLVVCLSLPLLMFLVLSFCFCSSCCRCKKRWRVCLFSWFRDPKLTPKLPQDDPGRSRGSQGAHWRLPGSPGRVLASHLGTPGPPRGSIWAPFLVPFWLQFSFKFRSNFFKDFGTHSGSIWVPFWEPKSTSEPLRREKVHLQKPLFYLSKTILFELGGSPGIPKSLPETTSKFIHIF